jgi:hypothetical protein
MDLAKNDKGLEPQGRNCMQGDGLQRRDFLRSSGITVTALAAGGSVIFGHNHAWAVAATTLDPHTTQTLLVMTRDLFPHQRLGEQYYAVVVDMLDKQAAGDPTTKQLLADGVAMLDSAQGKAWVDLPDSARETALRGVEKTAFFTTVRTKTISGLYGNPAVYGMFGYGGPSAPLGGYINRGFDDIDWLPNT